ncbi:LRRFIP2 [Cordylochernes scorpioides]|uniref:LRRFIP2 n=1 Tax=Cordylochernes scorpioides TaxID=51811 RepID=A0ABY6KFX1_9ARAC|nr:LRRFIP2 [Cordylochernes scorpioides]
MVSKKKKNAEARLAARRQARAEAREIRMRELEKQQKEHECAGVTQPGLRNSQANLENLAVSNLLADEQSDRHYEMHVDPPPRKGSRDVTSQGRSSSYASSRHSSEDLSEENKELRLSDLEEKFRQAMVLNAQLDNEKTSLGYQVELGRDEREELEEKLSLVSRQHRDSSRTADQLARELARVQAQAAELQRAVEQRDELIREHGLVLVGGEPEILANGDLEEHPPRLTKAALVSPESAQLLEQAGEGSLGCYIPVSPSVAGVVPDVRLKKFSEEKQDLLDEIYRLRLDLEEERQKSLRLEQCSVSLNGPAAAERDSSKMLTDYKYRLKKVEQENTTLQSTVSFPQISRLESQVSRYKSAADSAEAVEDELKAEKRKLLREKYLECYVQLREFQSRIEELETANAHLQKRIDKLKSTRNALMKS